MKFITSKLFPTYLLILVTSSSFSQNIEKMRKQAEEYYNSGDLFSAIATSKKVLEAAEKKFGTSDPEYAKANRELASYLYVNFQSEEALPIVEKAVGIYAKNPGKVADVYLETLAEYGSVLYSLNYFNKAEKINQECKEVLDDRKLTNDITYAIVLNNLAEVKRKMGKTDEAKQLYNTATYLFEKENQQNTSEYGNLLNNIANVYHDLANFTMAKKYYLSSLEVLKKFSGKNSDLYNNVLKNYSILLAEFGKLEEAKKIIEDVFKNWGERKGKNSVDYATCLNDLGNIYEKTGNFKKAEEYYLQAEAIKKKIAGPTAPTYWTTLNNMASLYSKLGDFSKSAQYMETIITSMRQTKSEKTPEYANYLNNYASYLEETDNFLKAEGIYKESLETIKFLYGEEHPDYSRVLNNLAKLNFDEKHFDRAEKYYLESLAILENQVVSNELEVAIMYNNLGEFYSRTKNFEKAEPLLKKALSIYKENFGENNADYIKSLSNLGIFYFRKGSYEQAFETEKATQAQTLKILSDNFSFLSEKEKMNYWKYTNYQVQFFNAFGLKAYKKIPDLAGEMFDNTLETKSIILHHSNLVKKSIMESGDENLIKKYNEWESKREQLAGYYNLKKSELKQRNIDIAALEYEVNNKEKELTVLSAQFSKLKTDKRKTWKDIREKLKPNEAAVEILRIETFDDTWTDSIVYVALIVTKETMDNPTLVILPDGKKMEKKYFKAYYNSMMYDKATPESYNIYWGEIEKYIKTKTVVYFSPAGIYNKISIPSLKMPNGKYLIEYKRIQIMPGLRTLLSHNSKPSTNNTAYLFGFPDYNLDLVSYYNGLQKSDTLTQQEIPVGELKRGYSLSELPGTKTEVEKISAILNTSGITIEKFLGDKALESKVKEINNPKVLHIATHGFFLTDQDLKEDTESLTYSTEKAFSNPLLRSGILLSGANNTFNQGGTFNLPEDGVLTAYEAMLLNLSNTDLVILSACETGLGEEKNGEGVFGLQRAFYMAGSKNILMSLWKVSDSGTQELMTLFYKYWLTDKNTASAFQKAQIELMKKNPSPYIWAAFVCVGY